MAQINHPAAGEELAHLAQTIDIIARVREEGETELAQTAQELSYARRFDPDMLPLREMLYARAVQRQKNLALAMRRPYFTRVNFTESGGAHQVYYIGKNGVMRSDSLEIVVVDWRSPVANLYYSGQVGPMHYVAPDGEVRGELTLKRQFGIEDGELKTIFDTDVVSQDAYLQSVLGAMTGERLKDIVTTIQAEQNFVIRHPLNVSLVVQGVAGSGKTTIALHRVAYLLYAFQEKLRPEHMLILAPNPLFLNFIAGVLPDLGVERVRQRTFLQLVGEWIKGLAVDGADRTSFVLAMSDADAEMATRVAQTKGALDMARHIDTWMDQFEAGFPLKEELRFGPVTLFTEKQQLEFLLVDEKPFPLARRLSEFQKELKRRVKSALSQVSEWLREETVRRADRIRENEADPVRRQEKLTNLYVSRDQRLAEAEASAKPYVADVMKRFAPLKPMEVYLAFWRDVLADGAQTQAMREAAQATLSRGKLKKLSPEDVAPLALLTMRLLELNRLDIRHVVVDEAQDFSPLEFLLLQRMTGGATMTIVGDLMQGVRAWRGLSDWRALTEGLFAGQAVMHHLVTSYRNTVEIMNVALRVARRQPIPEQQLAKPVLRHGPEPEFFAFPDVAAQVARIEALVRCWRDEGIHAIAVIERDEAKLKILGKMLDPAIQARFLDVSGEEYTGGVLLARAADVKGFEFDGVIVADAGAAAYPDRPLDARLLYVCLTRPLHRLACGYSGALTPLLTSEAC